MGRSTWSGRDQHLAMGTQTLWAKGERREINRHRIRTDPRSSVDATLQDEVVISLGAQLECRRQIVNSWLISDVKSLPGKVDVPLIEPTGTIKREFLCLLYTSPSPRDGLLSRMPSSA